MGIIDSLLGGGDETKSKTTIPKFAADYQRDYMNRLANYQDVAEKIYTANQNAPIYDGERLQGFTPDQLAGFELGRSTIGGSDGDMAMARSAASSGAAGYDGPIFDPGGNIGKFTSGTFTGDTVSKYMNPYISNVLDSAMARIGDEQGRQILNDRAAATKMGGFGGSGQAVLEALSRESFDKQRAETSANLLHSGYESGRTAFNADDSRALASFGANVDALNNQRSLENTEKARQLGAASTALDVGTTGQKLAQNDATFLSDIGTRQQAQGQAALDIAYGDWQAEQAHPYNNLQALIQAAQGNYIQPNVGSTTTNSTASQASPLTALAGVGMTAAGVGKAFFAKGGPVHTKRKRKAPAPPRSRFRASRPLNVATGGI